MIGEGRVVRSGHGRDEARGNAEEIELRRAVIGIAGNLLRFDGRQGRAVRRLADGQRVARAQRLVEILDRCVAIRQRLRALLRFQRTGMRLGLWGRECGVGGYRRFVGRMAWRGQNGIVWEKRHAGHQCQ